MTRPSRPGPQRTTGTVPVIEPVEIRAPEPPPIEPVEIHAPRHR